MPFHYVLANLLAESPDAIGVIFLDDAGETIDLASAEFAPYDLKVIGAYLGIYLRQVGSLCERTALGLPEFVHVEHPEAHLHVKALPDGYYLGLVQRSPTLVAASRRALRSAAALLKREVFT